MERNFATFEFFTRVVCISISFFPVNSTYNANDIHTADEMINQFADVHELLGKAMVNVSS